MKSLKKALLFGFFIWLIPFLVSVLIFPLWTDARPLFESIMPVVLTICVVFFLILYFRKVEDGFLREGVILGVRWLGISLLIDLPLFMWGPMKMTLADYMMDIGLTYLIIPTITIGAGYIMSKRVR